MNNVKNSRAVKFGTILCVTLLSALLSFTIRLFTHRNRAALFAFAFFAFALSGAVGLEHIIECVPNDAKDIWLIGI